jgi:large subunit ribosomal protein L16
MTLKKYKKYHTNKNIHKIEKIRSCVVKQGFFGIKAKIHGIITPKQVESVRRSISRVTKRSAKILIRLNFEQSLTKKPLLSRMGRGSGGISE